MTLSRLDYIRLPDFAALTIDKDERPPCRCQQAEETGLDSAIDELVVELHTAVEEERTRGGEEESRGLRAEERKNERAWRTEGNQAGPI